MEKLIFVIAILLLAAPAYAADVTVSWTPPDDDRVTGYIIYYGPENPPSANKIVVEGRETSSVDIADLPENEYVYFGAKSTDDNGNTSAMSDVVQWKYESESETIYHLDKPGGVGVITIRTTTTTTTTTTE